MVKNNRFEWSGYFFGYFFKKKFSFPLDFVKNLPYIC